MMTTTSSSSRRRWPARPPRFRRRQVAASEGTRSIREWGVKRRRSTDGCREAAGQVTAAYWLSGGGSAASVDRQSITPTRPQSCSVGRTGYSCCCCCYRCCCRRQPPAWYRRVSESEVIFAPYVMKKARATLAQQPANHTRALEIAFKHYMQILSLLTVQSFYLPSASDCFFLSTVGFELHKEKATTLRTYWTFECQDSDFSIAVIGSLACDFECN
jgi:hypothetical protein